MTEFISFVSDEELQKELSKDLRERSLEQKLFYISKDSADDYYNLYAQKSSMDLFGKAVEEEDYYSFLKKNLNKKEKIAIISLGCGDANLEKHTLNKLNEEGYSFKYIGVDISDGMLKKAEKKLEDLDIEKQLVRIDITGDDFKDRIIELTKDYDRRVFGFLGGTIGNANQTDIADTLYNILDDGDILWLDVLTRADLEKETDMKMFNAYSNRLENEKYLKFFFNPLKAIGVPFDSGKMGLKTVMEKSVGSMLFTYYFKIDKKTVIKIGGEKVHLLPSEEIELINIRAYHSETFIHFFEDHDFELIDRVTKGPKEQFIFKKN